MQGAKEIVLELGQPDSGLVAEGSRIVSVIVIDANNALFKEWGQNGMGEDECDDGSQGNQRDVVSNQREAYLIYSEGPAKRFPKAPENWSGQDPSDI